MMKLQTGRAKQLLHALPVKITEIENSDLAFHSADVADHFRGLCLPDGELIFGHIKLFRHIHKCFHGKGIMLGGDAEFLLQGSVLPVFLKDRLILSVELPCVQKELRPVIGQGYSPAAAIEQRDPQLFFQLLHGSWSEMAGRHITVPQPYLSILSQLL